MATPFYTEGLFMPISLLNSQKLISKLKTYFPLLEETETGVSNAYGYVICGFPKIFGANLRKERVNKGFTQKDMYMKLSVTPSTYSYWETGAHPPRVNKVFEILEILSIDAGDLISENPAISTTSQRLSIPILKSEELCGMTNDENFDFALSTKYEQSRIEIPFSENADFAFSVSNNDMLGKDKAIPRGATVLCSRSGLKGKNTEAQMEFANGKIVLLSIASGNGMLRELSFDGEKLTLTSWNKNYSELSFPVWVKTKNNVGTMWHGGETFAHNVKIFGIATKSIFSL